MTNTTATAKNEPYRGVYEHQRRLRAEESARKLFVPASYRNL